MNQERNPQRESGGANFCLRCGYDLRGNTSGKCPECGLGATVVVGVHDSLQFHRARAALERDQLLLRAIAPGVGDAGYVYAFGSPITTGWLWVDATQLDRVEACLDEAGVASWIGNLPIVDRSEPTCPKCNFPLDPQGPDTCPECGSPFQWVDDVDLQVTNDDAKTTETDIKVSEARGSAIALWILIVMILGMPAALIAMLARLSDDMFLNLIYGFAAALVVTVFLLKKRRGLRK